MRGVVGVHAVKEQVLDAGTLGELHQTGAGVDEGDAFRRGQDPAALLNPRQIEGPPTDPDEDDDGPAGGDQG